MTFHRVGILASVLILGAVWWGISAIIPDDQDFAALVWAIVGMPVFAVGAAVAFDPRAFGLHIAPDR